MKARARARFTTFASSIHAQRLSNDARITNPKKRKLFCLDSGLIVLFVRSQNRALCSIKLCVKKVSSRYSSEFVGANACVAARGNKVERGKDIFGQTNGRPFPFLLWGTSKSFFFQKILQQPP